MPYNGGSCHVDSVTYRHYDDEEFYNGNVDKHICQSIDPKQPNWGPGQGTVHALDQEVVQLYKLFDMMAP